MACMLLHLSELIEHLQMLGAQRALDFERQTRAPLAALHQLLLVCLGQIWPIFGHAEGMQRFWVLRIDPRTQMTHKIEDNVSWTWKLPSAGT